MTCRYSEEYLALYIEGELSQSELQAVERHVASCADCSEITCGLRESQKVVKSLRSDAVNSAVLANMHKQVMEELIQHRPRVWWLDAERALFAGFRWKYALAGFAGLVLVGGIALEFLWEVRRPVIEFAESVQPLPLDAPVESAAIVISPVPRNAPPAVSRNVVHAPYVKLVAAIPNDPPPVTMVKLYTDDPSIVIYWSLDGNGETR